jgi:hypothetical protein
MLCAPSLRSSPRLCTPCNSGEPFSDSRETGEHTVAVFLRATRRYHVCTSSANIGDRNVDLQLALTVMSNSNV